MAARQQAAVKAATLTLWTAPVWMAFLIGCGGAPQNTQCDEHRCDAVAFAIDPPPEAQETADAVMAELARVTGRPFVCDPFGIPVTLAPVVTDPSTRREVCGLTSLGTRGVQGSADDVVWTATAIAISTSELMSTGQTCGSLEHALRHEMIHALIRWRSICRRACFSASGDRSTRFEEGAIALICDSIGCIR